MTFVKARMKRCGLKNAASYTAWQTRRRHEAERKDETIFIPLLFRHAARWLWSDAIAL